MNKDLLENYEEMTVKVTPLSPEKVKSYSDLFKMTEDALKSVPDKIDGNTLTDSDKAQLLTNGLELKRFGVAYMLNDDNQIERYQFNNKRDLDQSLVLRTQVEYNGEMTVKPLDKPILVAPVSEEKRQSYSHHIKHMFPDDIINANIITEKDLKGVPDKIDDINLSKGDKMDLLTNGLEYKHFGVSYFINKDNQIERHQLMEDLVKEESLVLRSQVNYFKVENSLDEGKMTTEAKVKNAITERYPDLDLNKIGKYTLSINTVQEQNKSKGIDI